MQKCGMLAAWLWLCLAHSALGLRLSPSGLPGTDEYNMPGPDAYESPSAQCTGPGTWEVSMMQAGAPPEQDLDLSRLYPELPRVLNGTQWCGGRRAGRSGSANGLANRVALVMIGQAFRSRDVYSGMRSACTNGTSEVQEALARNHLERLVLPVEESLGMHVDIFLTDSPCAEEKAGKRGHSNGLGASASTDLREWYTPGRVKGVVKTEVATHMHSRVRDALGLVDDYMQRANGTYEYFVILRYDVFLDRSFATTLHTPVPGEHEPETAHKGLSFFGHAHDFLISFPAELWNCFLGFFDGCVQETETGRLVPELGPSQDVESRRQHGCFRFGPLQLPVWNGGFGLAFFWLVLGLVLEKRRGELVLPPALAYVKNGTSCFDSRGHEHRCAGDTYFPPRSSFEAGFQPCYFHVG